MRAWSIRACGAVLGTATALAFLLSGRRPNTCATAALEGETTRICTLVAVTPVPIEAWILVGVVGAVSGCALAEVVRRAGPVWLRERG